MVDDLDNSGDPAVGRVVGALDNNNAANLNEAPVGSLNQCFAHVAGSLVERELVVLSMLRMRGCRRWFGRIGSVLTVELFYPFGSGWWSVAVVPQVVVDDFFRGQGKVCEMP